MADSGEPSSELMGREHNYDSAEETKIKINNQTSTSNGTEIINSTLRGKMGHVIATEDYSNDTKMGSIRPSSPSSASHLPPQHRIANIIVSEDDALDLDGILGKNYDELDNEQHGGGAHSSAGTASITKSPSPALSPPAPSSAPLENNDTINSMQQHYQYRYPPIHNNMHNLQNGASHPLPLGYSNAPYLQYPSYYEAPAQQLYPPFNQPTLHYHQGFPSLYSNAPSQQYGMRGQTRSHSDGNLDQFHHQQPLDSFHNHRNPSLFPLAEHTPSHQNGMRGQTPGYPRSHSDGNLDSIHHHQPKVYHEKDYKTGRVWREDDHSDTTPGNSTRLQQMNKTQKINHSYSDRTQRAIPHYPTEVKQDCTVQSLTEEQVNLHEINSRRRSIRFGHIQIRTYENVICSNPSCSKGPALGLGWRYSPHETNVSIDKYEEAIFELTGGYRLSQLELLLDKSERVSILVGLGYTSNDLAESVRSIVKTKNQRRQTVDNLPVAWFEEKAEGFSRALGRMLKKRERARHMYDTWKNSESKKNRLLIY